MRFCDNGENQCLAIAISVMVAGALITMTTTDDTTPSSVGNASEQEKPTMLFPQWPSCKMEAAPRVEGTWLPRVIDIRDQLWNIGYDVHPQVISEWTENQQEQVGTWACYQYLNEQVCSALYDKRQMPRCFARLVGEDDGQERL